MSAYYNENDPYAAAWLRNLVAAGLIPAGDVDDRSILDVDPGDLAGFTQCHFFAGIGGWPYALGLAGRPAGRPVWTGSSPCQPFSTAGKQSGSADGRHLWPAWFRLIRECRPDTIFGEQVAAAVGFGWLDRVFADLEAEGYACGATILGAHSVGAPHIRQRLFWVADSNAGRRQGVSQSHIGAATGQQASRWMDTHGNGATGGMADAEYAERRAQQQYRNDVLGGHDARRQETHGQLGACREVRGLGDASEPGLQGRWRHPAEQGGYERDVSRPDGGSFWGDAVWLPCLDGKARRVEPTIFPLAHAGEWGTGSRVGILRGAGNAIIPQVAAEFIRAVMEAL